MTRQAFLLGMPLLAFPQTDEPRKLPLPELLRKLSDTSKRLIVGDRTVARLQIAPPNGWSRTTDDATLEDYLGTLTEALPPGVRWAKLWLPPPERERRWTGDDVAAYVGGALKLFPKIGAPEATDGKIELLGKRYPPTEAKKVIDALDLKPVYLLSRMGYASFDGEWETTFGHMVLTVRGNRVTGTYTSNNGVIDGTLTNSTTLRLKWVENGTSYGYAYFLLDKDGQRFSGKWASSETDPEQGSTWVGTRTDSDKA